MLERDEEPQTQSIPLTDNEQAEPGFLHVEEETKEQADREKMSEGKIQPTSPLAFKTAERSGTAEHLAARNPVPKINADDPAIKQRLREIQVEVTRQLTSLRWENKSIKETAESLIPLLNVGPVQQWAPVFIPMLFEIDRAGALIPTWLSIIESGDPEEPATKQSDAANTPLGRARRFAILMLGNYRTLGIAGSGDTARFAERRGSQQTQDIEVAQFLGQLATDPNTSLYATQSLVQHGTVNAMEALIQALEKATGWAKVDVIEGCLKLHQEHFYDLILNSGLDNAAGLENYIALPIYVAIPLSRYLQPGVAQTNSRLSANAALIFNQVLLDAPHPRQALAKEGHLPTAFEGPFAATAQSLFTNARQHPSWQNTTTLHRLGMFMGSYWAELSQGNIHTERVVEQINQVLPMMNDVERWMNNVGRDTLLQTVESGDKGVIPSVKVLGEMHDTRVAPLIISRLEHTHELKDRAQALTLSTLCETLGKLGDKQAAVPMWKLVSQTVDVDRRSKMAKRRDNLPTGDKDIPASIVYAGVVKASGVLGEQEFLGSIVRASQDIDPYVRAQALDALRRLDPSGEDLRSRQAARDALNDPRDTIVRSACQIVAQYRDTDAKTALNHLLETRPDLETTIQDTLRQL